MLTTNEIRESITPVLQKHAVEQAFLFGSYARGTNNARSDVDLMIIMNTAKRFLDRIAEFDELYDAMPGMAIDLLVYNKKELDQISHRAFIKTILKEGICLYGQ